MNKENESREEKLLLGVSDVQKITGLGRDRVYEIMHSGDFPVMKFGRQLKVHRDVFFDWINNKNNSNSYVYKIGRK
ncbi:helix-turn-helix domain-containing protein [Halalkalibacter okhensis]|uniref:helix-turn-helix domain-containing protein n=1 Tax=Halalkalibacter okhensis TaxID=333138 RepID=UPI00068A87C1|nr:helix-turn-helix domain-containing protein [Halalkalibacter okhensis]